MASVAPTSIVGESKYNVPLADILDTFGKQDPKQLTKMDKLYQDRYNYQSRIPVLLKQNEFLQRHLRTYDARKGSVVSQPSATEMKALNTTKDETRTILRIYGTMFGLIYREPSILSPIYQSPPYKYSEALVKLLTESILPNHFDSSHEHILTKITEDVMTYEFIHCEDLTTYLRENTCATKLLSSFLKRAKNAQFVDATVKEACQKCLINPKDDLEIDPNTIFEKSMNAIGEYHSSDQYMGPEDSRIQQLCDVRRRKLEAFVDDVLRCIIHPKRKYPIGLRIICRKLKELALSREPNNERLANGLVGGFLFLRIFNPKISLYSYDLAKKDPKNMASLRRRFTLISKVIQNISNQVIAGAKEKWMAPLNKFVQSRSQEVSKFFRDICDVPPLEAMFEIDQKIRMKQPGDEIVYISVSELNLLKKMTVEQLKIYKGQPTDSLSKREFYDQVTALANRSFTHTENDEIHSAYAKQTFVPINVHSTDNSDASDVSDATLQTERGLTQSLKISVIPVFYELYQSNSSKIDQLITQVETKNMNPNNPNANNLVTNCIDFLREASKSHDIPSINGIDNAIQVLENTQDKNAVLRALLRLYDKASELNEIFQRILVDTDSMRDAFEQMESKNKELNNKLRMKRKELEQAKLRTEQEHTRGQQRTFARIKNLVTAKDDDNDAKMMDTAPLSPMASTDDDDNDSNIVQLSSEIVAKDGMIGNMLVQLVNAVCDEMNELFTIKSGSRDRHGRIISNEMLQDLWERFPESLPQYTPIIQRVSRLGKMCLPELLRAICDSDSEKTSFGKATKDNRFRLSPITKNLKDGTKELQMGTFIVDFILADLFQNSLQNTRDTEHLTDQRSKVRMQAVLSQVVLKCVEKCKSISINKMDTNLGKKWQLKRTRKFGVILSMLTPNDTERIYDLLSTKVGQSIIGKYGFMYGAAYVQFSIDKPNLLIKYFKWIEGLIDNLFNTKDSKDPQMDLRRILHTMEHTLRSLYIPLRSSSQITLDELAKPLFNDTIWPMIGKINKYCKSEMASSGLKRLISTMLLKWTNNLNPKVMTHQFENTQTLIDKLIDFKFKEKKNVSLKLADILHFLRGGGSTVDESFSIRYEKYTIFEEKLLEQAYGRMHQQIGTSQCDIIKEKIFRTTRKYDRRNMDDASIFLLCACMIQMAVHNFAWVIKYIIEPFLSETKRTVERMYIPVYVLNFLCLPECKFSAYMSTFFAGQFSSQQYKLTINRIGTNVLNLLYSFLGQEIPIKKHLLTTIDANLDFTESQIQHKDEEIFFMQHVHKMLLFDWTFLPLEDYIKPVDDVQSEFLIICLRLAPHIEYDELWRATPDNCGSDGKFIGKWLMHKDERIREQVLRTILVAMRDSDKRTKIMKCFIQMLAHNDWHSEPCLIVLLKTVTLLLDTYRKEVIVTEEQKKRHQQQRVGAHNRGGISADDSSGGGGMRGLGGMRGGHPSIQPLGNSKNNKEEMITEPFRGKELPEWFDWQNKADALGLVYLCHQSHEVRKRSFSFLMKITEMYREFTGVGGGSTYIRRESFAFMNNNNNNNSGNSGPVISHSAGLSGRVEDAMKGNNNNNNSDKNQLIAVNVADQTMGVRTIGALIERYGRAIAKLAYITQDESLKHNASNLPIDNPQMSMKASGTHMQMDVSFLSALGYPTYVPSLVSQLAKKVVSSRLHETILCVTDFTLKQLENLPPKAKNRTGWSSDEDWKSGASGQQKTTYWTSLHTLLFAICGEGISNPFLCKRKEDKKFYDKERGIGGESYQLTHQWFKEYLDGYFWYCLYEDNIWVRSAIDTILLEAHWECVPTIIKSLANVFDTLVKKKKRNVTADVVYLLMDLGRTPRFPFGLFQNVIFTNEKIIKVFHGSQMDILWLQRDFGIYVVSMFDTFEASKLLNLKRKSLQFLLNEYCCVNSDKTLRMSDWRMRPLSQELLIYARMDTHYLLYIFDKMTNLLIGKSEKANKKNENKNKNKCDYLLNVLANSEETCLQIYMKPKFHSEGWKFLCRKNGWYLAKDESVDLLKKLYDWRDEKAREIDESVHYIMPNNVLKDICLSLPQNKNDLLQCCHSLNEFVISNCAQIIKVIRNSSNENEKKKEKEKAKENENDNDLDMIESENNSNGQKEENENENEGCLVGLANAYTNEEMNEMQSNIKKGSKKIGKRWKNFKTEESKFEKDSNRSFNFFNDASNVTDLATLRAQEIANGIFNELKHESVLKIIRQSIGQDDNNNDKNNKNRSNGLQITNKSHILNDNKTKKSKSTSKEGKSLRKGDRSPVKAAAAAAAAGAANKATRKSNVNEIVGSQHRSQVALKSKDKLFGLNENDNKNQMSKNEKKKKENDIRENKKRSYDSAMTVDDVNMGMILQNTQVKKKARKSSQTRKALKGLKTSKWDNKHKKTNVETNWPMTDDGTFKDDEKKQRNKGGLRGRFAKADKKGNSIEKKSGKKQRAAQKKKKINVSETEMFEQAPIGAHDTTFQQEFDEPFRRE